MRKAVRGFTIVEIIVIITVIGILSTIGIVSFDNIQKSTRDKQRYNQITIIGEALEKYYDAKGQYPDCDTLAANPTSILPDVDPDVFIPPNSPNTAIQCDSGIHGNYLYYITNDFPPEDGKIDSWELSYYSDTTKAISTDTEIIINRREFVPTIAITNSDKKLTTSVNPTDGGSVKIYENVSFTKNSRIALKAVANTGYEFEEWSSPNNNNCSGINSNISFKLDVDTNCVAKFKSTAPDVIPTPTMTTITASTPDNSTTWSWDTVICSPGTTANYQYEYYTTSGYQEYYGDPQVKTIDGVDTMMYILTANSYKRLTIWQGNIYTLNVRARCVSDSNSSLFSDWSAPKSANYTRQIETPTMTDISAVPTPDSTEWYWDNVTCPDGLTVDYHYQYTDGSYNSQWQPDNNGTIKDSITEGNATGYTVESTPTGKKYYRNTVALKTYTLTVEVRCSSPIVASLYSSWSAPKSASYMRQAVTPTMKPLSVTYDASTATWSWPPIGSCPYFTPWLSFRFKYSTKNLLTGTETANTGWLLEAEATAGGATISNPALGDSSYARAVGTVGNMYTLEVQARCSNFLDTKVSAWSNSESASYAPGESSNPAPSAPVVTAYFSGTVLHYANFEWTNTCPAGSTASYMIYYSNNYGVSGANGSIQSSNKYQIGMGESQGNYGKIIVKTRCKYDNDGKYTKWSAEGTGDLYRPMTDPTAPEWSEISRTTYNSYPATYITVRSSCGVGSSLYGVMDIYTPAPLLWYDKDRSPNYFNGWYGTESNESTWQIAPYQDIGSGIGATIPLYETDGVTFGTIPIWIPSGTQFNFRVRLYCQSDNFDLRSAITGVLYSGTKTVP